MPQKMGKNDFFLLFALAIIFIIFFTFFYFFEVKEGKSIIVTVNGKEYGKYELATNQSIKIKYNGKVINELQIKDGKASMQSATCPDKLCVKQHEISKKNETIVCLPNKVVVTVVDDDVNNGDNIDAISK
ncbi:NusG domain II-containing protein [Lachnobacterium bovis]|uniref:NusG domain II-containing protein n=1 Tax=Lachnobacterium bovis TaxID=140626 RepID=UPI00048DCC64|nr:NusG domain II-containing protein [Lachnobacterium bovis]